MNLQQTLEKGREAFEESMTGKHYEGYPVTQRNVREFVNLLQSHQQDILYAVIEEANQLPVHEGRADLISLTDLVDKLSTLTK